VVPNCFPGETFEEPSLTSAVVIIIKTRQFEYIIIFKSITQVTTGSYLDYYGLTYHSRHKRDDIQRRYSQPITWLVQTPGFPNQLLG